MAREEGNAIYRAGGILLDCRYQAMCLYTAAPIRRERESGNSLKTRLCQPEDWSREERKLFDRQSYRTYSIGCSRAPQASLKRRKPSLASDVRPKSIISNS